MINSHSPSNLFHQKKVTLYRNLTHPAGTRTIPQLIAIIQSDIFKEPQRTIQYLFSIGEKERANEEKKKLFSFTASCQCSLWRSLDNVTIYTSYLIFDIDGLTENEAIMLLVLLAADPYVMAAFRSPSWRGVKFIIETNCPVQDHKYSFDEAAVYYERLFAMSNPSFGGLGRKIDRSGSDICRLCFIGHDPLAFHKEHSIFKILLPSIPPAIKPVPRQTSLPKGALPPQSILAKAIRATNKKRQFYEGNRNNYVFLLACNCRFFGLNHDDALIEILNRYNYSQREIMSAVKSAYRYK